MHFQGIQESDVFIFLHSIMGGDPHHTFQNFCGLCCNIQFNPYAKSKVGLFVTNNIFLNVIWLLNLTLKYIGKFRLRQKSIPSGNYMFRVRKISRAMSVGTDRLILTDGTMSVGTDRLQFQAINLFISNYEKYIVLWAGKTCFYVYSPNISL